MDIFDIFSTAQSEELDITDIQFMRGLIMAHHFERCRDEGYEEELEMGFLSQNKRIMGYLNHLEDKKLEGWKMTNKTEEQIMNEITKHMETFSVNLEETQTVIRKMGEMGELLKGLPKETAMAVIDLAGEIANASVQASFKAAKEAERIAEMYSK